MVEITPPAPQQIVFSESLWKQMCSHVEACLPEEACGLLAGKGTQVNTVIHIENILHSSTKYRMNPVDQLRAFQIMDEQGQELIAIFHSHPNGPDQPSTTDVAEALYPESAYIILFPHRFGWMARAYLIDQGRANEIPLFRTGDL